MVKLLIKTRNIAVIDLRVTEIFPDNSYVQILNLFRNNEILHVRKV